MIDIKEIISHLKPNEKAALKKFYHNVKDKRIWMRYKLFEIYDTKQVGNDKEACHTLYQKLASSAYSNIKRKLLNDIISILFIVNEKSLVEYTLIDKGFRTRKLISAGELLAGRGSAEGNRLLEDGIEVAKDYERITEILSAQLILTQRYGFAKGLDFYKAFRKEMDHYIVFFQEFLFAMDAYYEILLSNIFSKNKESMFITKVNNYINKISKFKNLSTSPHIRFFYYHLEI